MQKESVESTSVSAIGYDPFSSVLEVLFINGRTYQYAQVSPRTYKSLMKARSKGAFLHRNVKGKYDYREVAASGGARILKDRVTDTAFVLA
jgi:hypothetical protein